MKTGHVDVSLHDALGRSISKLVNKDVVEGLHLISINLSDLASGIYSIVLTSSGEISTKKLIKE